MALTAAASDFDNASAALQRWLPPDHVKEFRKCLAKIADEPLPERAMALFGIVLSQFTSRSGTKASQEQVQMLLDSVFRPLAQYATSAPSVAGLFMTVHVVLETGSPEERKERRAIFTTRGALEDFLFPASSMVNDAELCHLYLRVIFQFSIDADSRALFALHSEFRDRMILLAQYATTEEATHTLFIVVKEFLTCPDHCRVLGTPSVRDHIFVARASFVTSSRCFDEYFRALLRIVYQDADPNPRAALFKTQAVRDTVFLPLVRFVTDSGTLLLFLTCLYHLNAAADTSREKTTPVFGTKAVRDRLIVPLVKHVTTDDLAWSFFLALGVIARGCPPNGVWFTTTALRDRVILPLAKYCSSSGAATAIASFVAYVARDPAAMVHLHTPKMRDAVFIPLARQNVTATSPVAVVDGFCNIVTDTITLGTPPNTHPSAVFATAAVRDEIIVPLAKMVTDVSPVCGLFRVISKLTSTDDSADFNNKTMFATPAIRDELFCRHAASVMNHDDAADVWNALFSLVNVDPQGTRRALFATAAVRDKVLVPLFEYVKIEFFSAFLNELRSAPLSVSADESTSTKNNETPLTESHSFSEEVFIALAEKATTGDGAARLAMTVDLY